jgi:hypothetical protein
MTDEKKFRIKITEHDKGWDWRVDKLPMTSEAPIIGQVGSAPSEILARHAAEKKVEELSEKPELKPAYTYEV